MKHIPIRTCIATGVKKPKSELMRLVRVEDPKDKKQFVVKVDVKGKERGRGANLDTNLEAFDLAVKKKAIERALKLERKLSEAELTTLRQEFATALEERSFRPDNKPVMLKISRAELEAKLGK